MRRLGPVLLLAVYGGAFAVAAFGGDVPAFDDHPGQLFRLWHFLEESLPAGAWTADWSPGWWGGYPELQFYPPGLALAGAAIRLLLLWRPSVETVYQLLGGLVLLLPALSTFLLLARAIGDRWLALPPAFLALTLSAGLRGGVEESVRWGMLTSRLSLGLLPLLVLALKPWIETGRRPVWAPVLAAAVVLAHPAGAPAVAAVLLVATLLAVALRPRRATLRDAFGAAVLAVALTAFWTLPLLARRAWLVPLAWGDFSLGGLLDEVRRRPVLLATAVTAPLAWLAVVARRRPFDALLATLPLALAAVLLADVALFARGWSSLEPARIVDGLALAALWAAGLALAVGLARLTPGGDRGAARPVLALVLIGLAVLGSGGANRSPTGEPTLTLWPVASRWPRLDAVSREHDLPRLWAALRGGSDRVLFLTSSLRLERGRAGRQEWHAPHSHVTSLTPLLAGREIVHGTFTHPAPLAARFYTGGSPARIDTLAEKLDGQSLLGQPWERLSAEAFDDFARRLRVATVVSPTADAGRARFLEASYARVRQAAGFTVFERRDGPDPTWPRVERITHRRYRVLVSPSGGVWIPTGISAYPLWQVKSRRGTLETRVDPWGLLEFRVPLDVFEAELVYSEGWLEWGGLAVTLAGALGWLAWAGRGRNPARRPAASPSAPRRGRHR